MENEKIGGAADCMVEIDGMCASKRKFNKGRRVGNIWCVWGICTAHKNAMFFEVSLRRRKGDLHNIVGKHVKSNTKICTDEWKGYLGSKINIFNLSLYVTKNTLSTQKRQNPHSKR